MPQNRFDVVCYLPDVAFDGGNMVRRMEIVTDGFWTDAVKLARESTIITLTHAGFKGIAWTDLAVQRVEEYNAEFPDQAL